MGALTTSATDASTEAGKKPASSKLLLLAALAVVLLAALLFASYRDLACEKFKAEVEGYTRALADQGVAPEQIAPLSSAALADREPEGCDYL